LSDPASLTQDERSHGKGINVVERDAATHQWEVSVENGETGSRQN